MMFEEIEKDLEALQNKLVKMRLEVLGSGNGRGEVEANMERFFNGMFYGVRTLIVESRKLWERNHG